MAIAKVCGIETEYGISVVGAPDANPITVSSVLINAYVSEAAGRVGWDFETESPGNDARGFSFETPSNAEMETHLVNTVLTNGARLYVDHAHPEYSSPECISPRQALLYDKAGEEVLRRAMKASRRFMPPGQEIVVYKNNSDRKGNSYGCHENYMMDRAVPFAKIVKQLTPFFVTRQIICGAGKVGSEAPGADDVNFQISQRADFFEEEVGLETTLKRPIINTRDEPHADPTRFRRLHVIIGDANLSEISTFLKLGSTAIVLSMIEDGLLDELNVQLASPVQALRKVSYDPTLKGVLETVDGRLITALEVQWSVFDLAKKYFEHDGIGTVGSVEEVRQLLDLWEDTLSRLEQDPLSLRHRLDWVAKLSLVQGYKDRHSLNWNDPKLAAIDLQYHDIRPEKSLATRAGLETMLDSRDVGVAMFEPPKETRAYFRGKCLEKFGDSIAAANWDSLIFDTASVTLLTATT
jgi:proteasome accessory factor PafA2